VELAGKLDSRGRPIYSVAARHVAEDLAEELEAKGLDDENRLLLAMLRKPRGSVAELALAAGFTSHLGIPQKSRVHRLLQQLHAKGLARKTRGGGWQLTPKGRTEADEVPE
jgi:hypothetical protein